MKLQTTILAMFCLGIGSISACGGDSETDGDSTSFDDDEDAGAASDDESDESVDDEDEADTGDDTADDSTDMTEADGGTDEQEPDMTDADGGAMADPGATDGGVADAGAGCMGPADCQDGEVCCATGGAGGDTVMACVAAGECGGGNDARICQNDDDCTMFEGTTCQEPQGGNLPEGSMVCRK